MRAYHFYLSIPSGSVRVLPDCDNWTQTNISSNAIFPSAYWPSRGKSYGPAVIIDSERRNPPNRYPKVRALGIVALSTINLLLILPFTANRKRSSCKSHSLVL